jgi:tetratricopeptide (TPR) repeat protein
MTKTSTTRYPFYIIAVLLPVVFLLLLEGALHFFNYKPVQPLFINAIGLPGYLQPNPKVVHRFFPSADMAPNVRPDSQYFLKQKPTESLRIVVQGGSTAAGFPYGRWGSLSGMLQQQFKRLYPDRQIEIINTAMASVNSYALLDFVDEIIQIEPDIVLIYAGHNEYLGIMGVGSAYASRGGRSANLLYLKFKNLKLYRLVESIYYSIFSAQQNLHNASQINERTLMAQIAKDKDIPYQSEVYNAGVTQFEGNMSLILDAYKKAKIKVVIGDLVSNEKDLIPFSAVPSLSAKELQQLSLTPINQLNTKISHLNVELESVDGPHKAKTYFMLGHAYYAADHRTEARRAFVQANDHDSLRFRAPSQFNQVLRDLAKRYQIPIAGVQAAFLADSGDGIIGSKHILEHLHPTVRGYFILARAYVEEMQKAELLPEAASYDADKSWLEQPVSKADAAYGEFKIARLTADYPFTAEPQKVSMPEANSIENKMLIARLKGQDWISINQALLKAYQQQKNKPEAAKIAGLLADALPNNGEITYIAGVLYKKAGNIPLSTHHLMRAINLDTNSVRARLSLAQNYFIEKDFDNSLIQLKMVEQIQPDNAQLPQFMNMVYQAKAVEQQGNN